jgi:mono/diheme cytochrome c family protein
VRTRSLALLCVVAASSLAACGEDDTVTLERTDTVAPQAPPPAADHDDRQSPRAVFAHTCGSCHALKAAGTSTVIGPDLDEARPSRPEVLEAIREGRGVMPANLLRGERAQEVAAYVARVAGR